jgi:hypothetical protein
MRRLLLTALLVTGACEQRPPIPITYVPQAPTPASAGTAAQQDSRRVNRAMGQETRQDRAQDADPYAASMSGMPTPSTDLDIGGNDVGQDVPQIGIPFSGI